MGIVSYAQNFEDVILWRALGHIPEGVYVDIGAHHPDIDSVSKAFHDRGWHGVHVEPGPDLARLLRDNRPGDTVLQAIVSDEPGVRPFYETPGGGLSTADRNVAGFHIATNTAQINVATVVSITLDDVLGEVPGHDIHWMKIDVEGFERRVLQSWRGSRLRPWILIIEATYPKTRISTHGEWEEIVLAKGYSFAYDDGLNRFYVSDEHPELRDSLIHPPNVFDEFQINPSGDSVFSQGMKAFMEGEIAAREAKIFLLENEREKLLSETVQGIAGLEADLAQTRAELRDAVDQRALQEALLKQSQSLWEQASARADELLNRLAEREATIAEQRHTIAAQNRRSAQLDGEVVTMKAVLGERDARLHSLVAQVLVNHSRRMPFWRRHQPGLGTPLGGMLMLPDAEFIDAAYLTILGREPDEAGKVHYLARLAGGRKRAWMLEDIAASAEAVSHAHGSDLAALSDEEFIDAAYQRVLGRASDPSGRAHYIDRLGSGVPRTGVMQMLRGSSEGRAHMGGLGHEINQLLRRRRSLLGWRTWFHPAPLPPLHFCPVIAATELGNCENESRFDGTFAHGDVHGTESYNPERLQRIEDRLSLVAAAIEGIERRS